MNRKLQLVGIVLVAALLAVATVYAAHIIVDLVSGWVADMVAEGLRGLYCQPCEPETLTSHIPWNTGRSR